jgi:hemerythrin-like metal-binding protein
MEEFIKWNDGYSVGHLLLDNQHKTLINLINELYHSMKNGKGKQALSKTLDDLVQYTIDHFSKEEQMMVKYSYPEFKKHKAEHEELAKTAINLQANFKNGTTPLTMDVLDFLKNWLYNHIEKTDKRYKGKLR